MAAPPLHSAAALQGSSGDVFVEVGPTLERYNVNKGFLTHYSDFFRKSLSGPWKEARSGVISLRDTECEVFNLFINWMYTQTLPENDKAWLHSAGRLGIKDDLPKIDVDMLKIKLYVFADGNMVPSLRRIMNREIVKEGNRGIDCWAYNTVIIYAYANLPSTDPLLMFFVDLHCANWDPDDTDADDTKSYQILPREFLLGCMKALGRVRAENTPSYNLILCDYHGHTSDDDRKACRKTWRAV